MKAAAVFRHQKRKLFGERVMLIRDEAATSIGLLDLPDAVRKQSGTIVMIGCDVDTEKHDVKVGDRTLFTRYQPVEVALELGDGTEAYVCIMHVSDLYVGWDEPELRVLYEAECEALS